MEKKAAREKQGMKLKPSKLPLPGVHFFLKFRGQSMMTIVPMSQNKRFNWMQNGVWIPLSILVYKNLTFTTLNRHL